jgi:hypothetical protein
VCIGDGWLVRPYTGPLADVATLSPNVSKLPDPVPRTIAWHCASTTGPPQFHSALENL